MTPPPDRFTNTTPNPVDSGAVLHIVYENPDKAGETVTISVKNGNGDGGDHQITLDSDGKGTLDFTVPGGWQEVFLNGPDSAEKVVTVNP